MNSPSRLVLKQQQDRIYLAKAVCERAGLLLTPHPQNRFGFVAYSVEIPSDYPKERARRVARLLKGLGPRVRLGQVRRRLLDIAGDHGSPWTRRSYEPPLWVRVTGPG